MLKVPGRHNRANAALAATVASAAGAARDSIARGLAAFIGLPHRLQVAAEIDGRLFINDSKATTPEAAIAALESMDRPTWILLGGSDKQIDLAPLAAAVARKASGAALFGTVAAKLDHLLSTRCADRSTTSHADTRRSVRLVLAAIPARRRHRAIARLRGVSISSAITRSAARHFIAWSTSCFNPAAPSWRKTQAC